jgi:ribosome biogenesis GTPase / thiamine phosphate phosphatase
VKEQTGTVTKVFGLYYTVKHNNIFNNCVLRGKIRQSKELKIYSDPVAVGDNVIFELNDDGNGVINEILKRKNLFSRKEKGKNKKEDIIACNLDQVVIIQSFKNPKLNLRFIDRLIVRCEKEKISVLVCINKLDIAEKNSIKYIENYYSGANINLIMTSAANGKKINELKEFLRNKVSLFIGTSGVGKTSILNYIAPGLNRTTSEVSQSTNKGRHTTANVEMIDLPGSITIIDSPGVREFGLTDIEPHMLGFYFNEFNPYLAKCNFNPCTHDHEPDCEVKRQVENGAISGDRYISYINILNSLREYYERKYE